MQHKHAKLIKRWADNTELVILVKDADGVWRSSMFQDCPSWDAATEYYLSSEEHLETALHWLNGGEIEMYTDSKDCWTSIGPEYKPSFSHVFRYRIKPKFEPEHGKHYLVTYISDPSATLQAVLQYDQSIKAFVLRPRGRVSYICWDVEDVEVVGDVEIKLFEDSNDGQF